jgi:hypothetical protein
MGVLGEGERGLSYRLGRWGYGERRGGCEEEEKIIEFPALLN